MDPQKRPLIFPPDGAGVVRSYFTIKGPYGQSNKDRQVDLHYYNVKTGYLGNQKHDIYNDNPFEVNVNRLFPIGENYVHYTYLADVWSYWYYSGRFYVMNSVTISSPTPSQVLWGSRPLISGSATAGGHIQILRADNNQALSAQTTVLGGSTWSVALNASLVPATYTAKVKHWMTGYTPIYSDNFTFILRPLPSITTPGNNGVIGQKPFVSGTGEPSATVFIHKSGDGTTVYGTATVQSGRNWSTTLTRDLPQGVYKLSAKQRKENSDSGWIETPLQVKVLGVPSISSPAAGEQEQNFTMTGGGGLANQNVQVEVFTGSTNTSWGVGTVQNNGIWSVALSNLTPGSLSLTASQKLGGVNGDRPTSRTYKIRPPKLSSITVAYPDETTVRLSGRAHNGVGADTKVHIHYKGNNPPPLPDVAVPNISWTKDITGLLPSNAQYTFDVQQSVSDGSVSGRIRNTGWTTALVTVITPKPTLNTPTLSGQIPRFSGGRNVWEDTRGGGVQIQLNGQTHPFLPDLQGSTVSWNITASGKIAPGSYTVRARQGINSRWSEFTVLAAPLIIKPDLPELFSPAAGVETPRSVQFHGKTWPNATVVVRFKSGDLIREVPSNGTTGEWSFNHTLPLGRIEVTVQSTFGGQSSEVKNQSFPVKTPPPVVTSPANNSEVSPFPIIKGTGLSGCWVYVYQMGTTAPIGQAEVGTDNQWEVTLAERPIGNLTIYTKQIFSNTFESDQTAVLPLKVIVPAPGIDRPAQDSRPARTMTVEGQGALYGGSIDLMLNGQPSDYKGIQVRSDGSWQVDVSVAAAGVLTIKAIQSYKEVASLPGNERRVTVVPAVPVIDTPRNAEALGALLRISGFGYPGDSVRIDRSLNFTKLGVVEVTGGGTWSMLVRHNMVAGDGITAIAYPTGNEALSSGYSPMIEMSLLKPAPKITGPLAGDWVAVRPQYSGVAEPNAIITVASWFNTDNLLALPTPADERGEWEVTGNQGLPVGAAWVVVRQTLPDGTASEWAESGRFMVEE
jgi:hypothetical protein